MQVRRTCVNCVRTSRDSVAREVAPAYECHLSVCRERSNGVGRARRDLQLCRFFRGREWVTGVNKH